VSPLARSSFGWRCRLRYGSKDAYASFGVPLSPFHPTPCTISFFSYCFEFKLGLAETRRMVRCVEFQSNDRSVSQSCCSSTFWGPRSQALLDLQPTAHTAYLQPTAHKDPCVTDVLPVLYACGVAYRFASGLFNPSPVHMATPAHQRMLSRSSIPEVRPLALKV
jgi:hypothetical protein